MRITLLSYKDVGLYIQYWWKYECLNFTLCSDRRGLTHLNMIEMAAPSPTIILVPLELVAWWVKHHSLRLHVLFNRKKNNNNPKPENNDKLLYIERFYLFQRNLHRQKVAGAQPCSQPALLLNLLNLLIVLKLAQGLL